jgi:hypothetical protein
MKNQKQQTQKAIKGFVTLKCDFYGIKIVYAYRKGCVLAFNTGHKCINSYYCFKSVIEFVSKCGLDAMHITEISKPDWMNASILEAIENLPKCVRKAFS